MNNDFFTMGSDPIVFPNMVKYAHKHEQGKAHGNRGERAASEVFGCIPHGARAYRERTAFPRGLPP